MNISVSYVYFGLLEILLLDYKSKYRAKKRGAAAAH